MAFLLSLTAGILPAQDLLIEEIVARNDRSYLVDGAESPDWIELRAVASVDLGDFSLCDCDEPNRAMPLTEVLGAGLLGRGERLVVTADGSGSGSLDFRLAGEGKRLTLFGPGGGVVDSIRFPALPRDVSYGRGPDGGWGMYTAPTPGRPNGEPDYLGVLAPPVLRQRGGATFDVTPPRDAPRGYALRFTTDGRAVTADSPLWSPRDFDTVTALRFRGFGPGYLPSPPVFATALPEDLPHDLPIVSLTVSPAELFDVDTGIYVLGPNASPTEPSRAANYYSDEEVRAHVAIYSSDGTRLVGQEAGLRLSGSGSRVFPQKSFAVIARSRYGSNLFTGVPPPVDRETGDHSPGAGRDLKSFVLRNAGNDNSGAHLRDAVTHALARPTSNFTLGYQPTVTYINGTYWGILNLREKPNEHYAAARSGGNSDDIDLLKFEDNGYRATAGSAGAYTEFLEELLARDPTAEETYDFAAAHLDLANYIDYQATEIYCANHDWPGNNVRWFRDRGGDGRWRFILFDTDFGFASWGRAWVGNNTLALATAVDGERWPNPPASTALFRALLANPRFAADFANRVAGLLNTHYRVARVESVIDSLAGLTAAEWPRHANRWSRAPEVRDRELANMRHFAAVRGDTLREHLRVGLGLGPDGALTLVNALSASGTVRINREHPLGVDTSWTGTYFAGTPVEVEAEAMPGYEFICWRGDTTANDARIQIDVARINRLEAQFAPALSPAGGSTIGSLSIYPNPVGERAFLRADGLTEPWFSVSIYDALGRPWPSIPVGCHGAGRLGELSTAGLPVGVYTALATDAEGTVVARGKFVKLQR